jgi:hypothetical protein
VSDRTVKVSLVIDDKGSVKVLRQAGHESGRTEGKLKNLDRSIKGLGKSFGGLKGMIGFGFGALTGGGLALGIDSIASKTKEVAEQTEKFSSISGLGATQSLRFNAALRARGISTDSVGRAFFKLGKTIQTAEQQERAFAMSQARAAAKGRVATTSLGAQAKAFVALGISATAFGKLTEEQKMESLIKRLSAIKDGTEKNTVAQALFSKSAVQLIPVLKGGALGFEHQYNLAKKFFPTIKGEGKQAMQELLLKQAESKMAWEGLEFTIGQKLIPTMTSAMGAFSGVVVEVEKGKGAWGGLRTDIEGVASAGKGVVVFFEKMGKAFNIPVEAGALAAFAGIHTLKHPVKTTRTSTKFLSKAAKFAYQHPVIAGPEVIFGGTAAALTAAYGIDVYKSRKELAVHAQGALGMLKGGASFQSILAAAPGSAAEANMLKSMQRQGYGNTRLGGKAATGVFSPMESKLVSRLLEHPSHLNQKAISGLTPAEIGVIVAAAHRGEKSPKVDVHLDSTKIAEALMHNPRARRIVAETTAKEAAFMTARK